MAVYPSPYTKSKRGKTKKQKNQYGVPRLFTPRLFTSTEGQITGLKEMKCNQVGGPG
jgi:hypothetical protein